MVGRQSVNLTPREVAALDRLLDAYLATDEGDPGLGELASVLRKLQRLNADHTSY